MSTVAAISTGRAPGGIGVVRISGENAISIADKVFSSFNGKKLCEIPGYSALYGKASDEKGSIDNVVALVFKAPKSYTGEDVVEISCHGGLFVTDKVLKALYDAGAIPAEPGEFTKRAFLNGRIDLLEAEAVMDMIDSKTEQQRKMAINQISGKVSSLINDLRNDMVQIISNINVNIDYPEYDDVDIITNDILIPKINNLKEKINKILKESENGKMIKNSKKPRFIRGFFIMHIFGLALI